MLKSVGVIYNIVVTAYLCKKKENVMAKRLLILVCFVTFAIYTSASRLPLYLNCCSRDDNSHGNSNIWQHRTHLMMNSARNVFCCRCVGVAVHTIVLNVILKTIISTFVR